MPWPYAALVWDVVLPLQALDKDAIVDFYTQRSERFNPEKLCTAPSASPPATTPAPATPTPATPTASPAGSPVQSQPAG